MTSSPAPHQTKPPSANWSRAIPIKIGLGMTANDHPLFGAFRCTMTVDDEGGGPFLIVEFINDEPGQDSPHCGYFNSHADIDQFADQLHAILKNAEEASA